MGIPAANGGPSVAPPAGDLAGAVLTGTITATGGTGGTNGSGAWPAAGWFNVSLWGTFSAVNLLQRSFDGGVTWITRTDITMPTGAGSIPVFESERGVLYQIGCTFTSGTVNYRFSAGGFPSFPPTE